MWEIPENNRVEYCPSHIILVMNINNVMYKQNHDITLFRSIAMFYEIDNNMQNIPPIQIMVMNDIMKSLWKDL
jgi:phosphosulfolactate synthase (CoM biosynthesis protein A)